MKRYKLEKIKRNVAIISATSLCMTYLLFLNYPALDVEPFTGTVIEQSSFKRTRKK